ncbi:MAG: hypothetical protein HY870_06560 [Chloroflexi bacterium]|nr:hypothetical protein [Chloroflexota bacterium]
MNSLHHPTIGHLNGQTILRWRWPIALVSAAWTVVAEVLEHQTLDVHFVAEILLYGGLMPVGIWWLLTQLARHLSRRTALQHELDRHQHISQQLARYQDRDELARFIARFPATILPVSQATLFQYDYLKAQLELMADWHSDARQRTTVPAESIAIQGQNVCPMCRMGALHWAADCPFVTDRSEAAARHYCVPLTHDKLLVGLLRLRFAKDVSPPVDQLDLLNALIPQMVLALALSIARPQRLVQVQAEARSDERRHVAYELHDSLAQHLSYLHLSLDRLSAEVGQGPDEALHQELSGLREIAAEAYRQVRDQLAILRAQQTADLIQSLRHYTQLVSQRSRVRVTLVARGESARVPAGLHSHVFSLVRESLNNVQRHARAYEAQVGVFWNDDLLIVVVTDDGVGFNPAAHPAPDHHGLAMLRERIGRLNGQLHIHSAPNRGTRLFFYLPLDHHSREAAGPRTT